MKVQRESPLFPTPRYLVPFHPKRQSHYFTDVLIIGGGLAGLRAANAPSPDQSVLVVTKDELAISNSRYAQGGIAGVLDPSDHVDNHIRDTLDAGARLCDPRIVNMVIQEGPQRIKELIQWGTQFDREDGELVLGREGGHSHNRIVHARGDATGAEVMRAVIEWTKRLRNVTIWENAFTLDLLTDENGCRGALIVGASGATTCVWAKQVILSTGGAGRLYRESTNPKVATGDGHALAFRAGAEIRDLEFMQFHPTVLYIAGSSRSLITEAIRGEGGRLVDCHGDRFMKNFDERGELAPRDIVSQAIVSQMETTKHPCVYLDMSHLNADFVRGRFPGIAETCRKFGLDIATDRIPVRPGAHYMIGGITVDDQGKSSLEGLWAAGEVCSTGLHGANRLASNSLLEGLVYGARAGVGASEAARAIPDSFRALPIENLPVQHVEEPLDLDDIQNSLQSLMWRNVGVRRTADSLAEAATAIASWCAYVLVRQFETPDGWELQNLLTLARLTVSAAKRREESRGVHLRMDFPDLNQDDWSTRVWFRRDKSGAESTGKTDVRT
jgi:L-aspartate oxidase